MLRKDKPEQAVELLIRSAETGKGNPAAAFDKVAQIYHENQRLKNHRIEVKYLRLAVERTTFFAERDPLVERLYRAQVEVDSENFEAAFREHSIAEYELYLKGSEPKLHAQEARHAIEDLLAERALSPSTEEAYRAFLESEQGKEYRSRDRVINELHKIAFESCQRQNSLDTWTAYRLRYPKSPYAEDAERHLYAIVEASHSIDTYHRFLQDASSALECKLGPDPQPTPPRFMQDASSALECKSLTTANTIQAHMDRAYQQLYGLLDKSDPGKLVDYLTRYPEAPNLKNAEQDLFAACLVVNTEGCFAEFIRLFPTSETLPKADEKLFALYDSNRTVQSYERFLTTYAASTYRDTALDRIYSLYAASNTEDGYRAFLNAHQDDPRTRLAYEALFELYASKQSEDAFQQYVQRYPHSPLSKKAERAIYQLYERRNTEDAYRVYLQKHPAGPHRADAHRAIYNIYAGRGTPSALAAYLRKYPGAPHHGYADLALFHKCSESEAEEICMVYLSASSEVTNVKSAHDIIYRRYASVGTEKALRSYLARYPRSPNRNATFELILERYYRTDNLVSMQTFLATYPAAPNRQTVQNAIAWLQLKNAEKNGETAALAQLADKYYGTLVGAAARQRLRELNAVKQVEASRSLLAEYSKVDLKGTPEAYSSFAKRHPKSPYAARALEGERQARQYEAQLLLQNGQAQAQLLLQKGQAQCSKHKANYDPKAPVADKCVCPPGFKRVSEVNLKWICDMTQEEMWRRLKADQDQAAEATRRYLLQQQERSSSEPQSYQSTNGNSSSGSGGTAEQRARELGQCLSLCAAHGASCEAGCEGMSDRDGKIGRSSSRNRCKSKCWEAQGKCKGACG